MERKVLFVLTRASQVVVGVGALLIFLAVDHSAARTLTADTTLPAHHLTVSVESQFGDAPVQTGFGFIVAIDPLHDSVDIVTPNHVVRMAEFEGSEIVGWSGPDSVWVNFFRGNGLSPVRVIARLMRQGDAGRDLAFVRAKPPYPIDAKLMDIVAHSRMYRRGSPVWYVGKWENNEAYWYVPPHPGTLTYPDTLSELAANGLDIRPGRSGAPLYVDSGVVGIVTRTGNDFFYARPMTQIAEFAKGMPSINYMLKDYEWFSFAPKWYFGFGTGYGQMNTTFTVEDTVYDWDIYGDWVPQYVQQVSFGYEESGQGVNVRIARGMKNNFLLGADLDLFWFDFETTGGTKGSFNLGNMSLSLSYYLSNSVYVRGGPAVSVGWIEEEGQEDITENGTGFTIGGGAQLRIGENWFFVPSVSHNGFNLETAEGTFLNIMGGLIYVW